MAVELSRDHLDRLAEATKAYVRDEWDADIGDLKARLFAEFVVETFGPAIHNAAIQRAQTHLARMTSDLDVELHEPEP